MSSVEAASERDTAPHFTTREMLKVFQRAQPRVISISRGSCARKRRSISSTRPICIFSASSAARRSPAKESSKPRGRVPRTLELTTMLVSVRLQCHRAQSGCRRRRSSSEKAIRLRSPARLGDRCSGTTAGFGDRAHLAFIQGRRHPPNVGCGRLLRQAGFCR